MKVLARKTTAFMLALIMMFTFLMSQTVAAQVYNVNVTVKYGQTEARKMLSMINKFRTGSDAWYWNSSNTQKVKCSDLGTMVYDYELEKAAMQRAAEIVLSFSHTRPNGEDCFTAYDTGYSAGENIATGYYSYNDASSVFEGWQETNEKYGGQGHRRNMLQSSIIR